MRASFAFSRKGLMAAAAAVVCAVSLVAASSNTEGVKAGVNPDEPPAALHINDVEFRVQMQPFPDTYAGMTHFETRVVQIDPSSVDEERRRVFLHEMLHVAWHQGKASTDKAHAYTEEEAIQALTPGLLKVLQQNPQSIEYLRAEAQDKQLLRTTASK